MFDDFVKNLLMKKFSKLVSTHATEDRPSTSAGISHRNSPDYYGAPQELLPFVVGHWNRWRVLIIFLFCLIMFFSGLNIYASDLLFPQHLDFNCSQDDRSTDSPCYTTNKTNCQSFSFSQRYGHTMTEKWKLVCEDENKVTYCRLCFRYGRVVGYIVTGHFMDKWGRKLTLFISLLLQPFAGMLLYASKDYYFFLISTLCYALTLTGTYLIAIVIACEISSNEWRTLDMGALYLSLAVGHMLLPYLWMIFADSTKNLIFMSLSQFFLIGFMKIIHESPNWLLCENQTNKAESVLLAVARFRGQIMPSYFRLRPIQITNYESRRSKHIFSILEHSRTRWSTLALIAVCVSSSFSTGVMVEQILSQNDDYLKMVSYSGFIHIAGAIFSLTLCHIMDHKLIIPISSVLACICATVTYNRFQKLTAYNHSSLLTGDLLTYGLFKIAAAAVWNMTPRVFPTEMRGQGTGISIAVGEMSFSIAGLLLPRIQKSVYTFLYTLWGCTLIIILSCYFLLSVHHRELPDILDDSINFKSTYKPTRWTTLRGVSPTIDETEVNTTDFEKHSSVSVQLTSPFHCGKFRRKKPLKTVYEE